MPRNPNKEISTADLLKQPGIGATISEEEIIAASTRAARDAYRKSTQGRQETQIDQPIVPNVANFLLLSAQILGKTLHPSEGIDLSEPERQKLRIEKKSLK